MSTLSVITAARSQGVWRGMMLFLSARTYFLSCLKSTSRKRAPQAERRAQYLNSVLPAKRQGPLLTRVMQLGVHPRRYRGISFMQARQEGASRMLVFWEAEQNI
jgi:hypothetical protein